MATQAEAFLYLEDAERALSKYRQALSEAPTPREVEAIFEQATTAAGYLGDDALVARLTALFRGSPPDAHTDLCHESHLHNLTHTTMLRPPRSSILVLGL